MVDRIDKCLALFTGEIVWFDVRIPYFFDYKTRRPYEALSYVHGVSGVDPIWDRFF
jgi:hypothetical protein